MWLDIVPKGLHPRSWGCEESSGKRDGDAWIVVWVAEELGRLASGCVF